MFSFSVIHPERFFLAAEHSTPATFQFRRLGSFGHCSACGGRVDHKATCPLGALRRGLEGSAELRRHSGPHLSSSENLGDVEKRLPIVLDWGFGGTANEQRAKH